MSSRFHIPIMDKVHSILLVCLKLSAPPKGRKKSACAENSNRKGRGKFWGSNFFGTDPLNFLPLFIPVTRRVKGYTRSVGKYVTGIRKRIRPHKVYIFLIRIRLSVCFSVRMNAEISETIRARLLSLGMQIPELLT